MRDKEREKEGETETEKGGKREGGGERKATAVL